MRIYTILLLLIFALNSLIAQNDFSIKYSVFANPELKHLEINIEIDSLNTNGAHLIIPRSGPGTYDLTNYLAYVKNVKGYTISGKTIYGLQGRGSFFFFREKNEMLIKVSYEVDLEKMEYQLKGGFASSKIRDGYIGILGYSVFGFFTEFENSPCNIEINAPKDWPIFSSLKPSIILEKEIASYKASNFSELADAQFLMGPDLQIHSVEDAKIPLFVAAYAETSVDVTEIGRRANIALNGLAEYFEYIPMPHYTVCYEFLIPYSKEHEYGFSMEHLNSMTASLDTSRAVKAFQQNPEIGGIVHHMGHSWIPLRSYGEGYRPFEWQTAPIIETIWLNEGFIWFVTYSKVLKDSTILDFYQGIMDFGPKYIQDKSLKELSRLGSTQYSLDFNIGRTLFAKGAMMAYEMDQKILIETNGQSSFQNSLINLLEWTEENQRAFKYDDILDILEEGLKVELDEIWQKWQN